MLLFWGCICAIQSDSLYCWPCTHCYSIWWSIKSTTDLCTFKWLPVSETSLHEYWFKSLALSLWTFNTTWNMLVVRLECILHSSYTEQTYQTLVIFTQPLQIISLYFLCYLPAKPNNLILEVDMEKLQIQWHPETYEWHISTTAHYQRLNVCTCKVWGFQGSGDSYCFLTGVMSGYPCIWAYSYLF